MKDLMTYEELTAREDAEFISEYDGFLYVKLPPKSVYENTIWKVDKKTKQVESMMYVSYLRHIYNRATYIKAPVWETQSEKEERGA